MRTTLKEIPIIPIITVTCDRCNHAWSNDTTVGMLEIQEFLHYNDTCGYGALGKFQDGDMLELDLCQYCKAEVLGQWMRKTNTSE